MFYKRLDCTRWLTLTLIVGLAALPGIGLAAGDVQDDKQGDKQAESPKAPKSKTDASSKGVVLRPESVDGTVSAYSAAVRKADPGAKVYTNADLERMWAGDPSAWATAPSDAGAGSAPTPVPGAAPAPDLLEQMTAEADRAQHRAKSIAAAEADLVAANAAVANLEKQMLAVRNPFSARPQLSDEEKAARADGESAAQRLERTEQQLKDARQRVLDAQTILNQLRRSR